MVKTIEVNQWGKIRVILFTALLGTGMLVCGICDLAIAGRLTWSLIVWSSILAAWVVGIFVARSGKKGIRTALIAFSIVLVPFLYVLSCLIKVRGSVSDGGGFGRLGAPFLVGRLFSVCTASGKEEAGGRRRVLVGDPAGSSGEFSRFRMGRRAGHRRLGSAGDGFIAGWSDCLFSRRRRQKEEKVITTGLLPASVAYPQPANGCFLSTSHFVQCLKRSFCGTPLSVGAEASVINKRDPAWICLHAGSLFRRADYFSMASVR